MKGNDVAEAEELLSLGADVDAKQGFGTALHWAAFKNSGDSHYGVMELLLKNGADVNAYSDNYVRSRPLYHLLPSANAKTVKLLLDYKADVNSMTLGGEIPLSCAADYNETNIIKLLVNYGTDVNNDKDLLKITPFHKACTKKSNFWERALTSRRLIMKVAHP